MNNAVLHTHPRPLSPGSPRPIVFIDISSSFIAVICRPLCVWCYVLRLHPPVSLMLTVSIEWTSIKHIDTLAVDIPRIDRRCLLIHLQSVHCRPRRRLTSLNSRESEHGRPASSYPPTSYNIGPPAPEGEILPDISAWEIQNPPTRFRAAVVMWLWDDFLSLSNSAQTKHIIHSDLYLMGSCLLLPRMLWSP